MTQMPGLEELSNDTFVMILMAGKRSLTLNIAILLIRMKDPTGYTKGKLQQLLC